MARVTYLYRKMFEFIRTDVELPREHHDPTVVGCRSRWPRPLHLPLAFGPGLLRLAPGLTWPRRSR